MENTVKNFSAVLWILLALSITANAQVAMPNQLRVVVTDAQNQVIAGAKCVLSQNKKTIAEVQTDARGAAIFANLTNGIYELKIEKEGFEKYEKREIAIGSDAPVELTVTLNVGAISAEVTVENSAENVNTVEAGSSPSADVQRKTIERLPLATKRIDEAISLVPGVIRTSNGEISINGATEQQSSFRVNDLNVADPASGNFRLNLPVDAVESVQVFRHPYSAEFGQFTGGLTNIKPVAAATNSILKSTIFCQTFVSSAAKSSAFKMIRRTSILTVRLSKTGSFSRNHSAIPSRKCRCAD